MFIAGHPIEARVVFVEYGKHTIGNLGSRPLSLLSNVLDEFFNIDIGKVGVYLVSGHRVKIKNYEVREEGL